MNRSRVSSRLHKRSVSLAGRKTSIALEPEFWAELDRWAGELDTSRAQLIGRISAMSRGGLAAAIRVAVLQQLAARARA